MKTEKKIGVWITMTLAFSMILQVTFAQEQKKQTQPVRMTREQGPQLHHKAATPPPPHADVIAPPPPPSADSQDEPGIPRLDLPGLTGEQKEKIRKTGLDHLKAMTPLKNQVREKRARLQTLLTTMPFDARSADLVAEELGKAGTAILKEMIRHDQELRTLLTPEQQVLFDDRPKPFLHRKHREL